MINALFLCDIDELEDPGSKGFYKLKHHEPFFIVRKGSTIFAYKNSCPHYRAPLDWKQHAFLTFEKNQILCSMHGAIFEINNGLCVHGPCRGKSLTPIPLHIENGAVYLKK